MKRPARRTLIYNGGSYLRHVRAGGRHEYSLYLPHRHVDIQLLLIGEGSGRCFVGGVTVEYRAGDVLLIGKDVPHCFLRNEGATDAVPPFKGDLLQFREELFPPHLETLNDYLFVGQALARSTCGVLYRDRTLFGRLMAHLQTIDRHRGIARITELILMLELLGKNRHGTSFSEQAFAAVNELYAQDDMMRRAHDYISANLSRKITLWDVSARAGLTPAAFCRAFRARTGMTLTQFINKLRLGNVCTLLAHSHMDISQAAFASGFNNLAYFNRRFKAAMSIAPSVYRAQIESDANL